jgi:hypothetical protein
MEHFEDLIIDFNITQKKRKIDWALYDNNIFELLDVCPIFIYFGKTSKFINMFPNIKRTRSQIMNHMKHIYTKNFYDLPKITKFNHHTLNAL